MSFFRRLRQTARSTQRPDRSAPDVTERHSDADFSWEIGGELLAAREESPSDGVDAARFQLHSGDDAQRRDDRRRVRVIDAARTDGALQLIESEPDARYTVVATDKAADKTADKVAANNKADSAPVLGETEPQRADPSLTARYRGADGERRTEAVRTALDGALDAWWRDGALPDTALLRDALLVLEAGHALNESSRSLLLRAALHHGRGMVTALRHPTDPERTAVLLHETIVEPIGSNSTSSVEPLPPAVLRDLQQADRPRSLAWSPPLLDLLRADATRMGTRRATLARAAVEVLASGRVAPLENHADTLLARPLAAPVLLRRRHSWFQLGILVTLLLVVGVVYLWRWFLWEPSPVVDVPGGSYSVTRITENPIAGNVQISTNGADTLLSVDLAPFVIDRLETTNREYARCVQAGVCPTPLSAEALSDPVLLDHPVSGVDWNGATAYCAFVDKRLPTAAEWEVAAGFAPATDRYFRYPWGDRFARGLVNSARTGGGETQPVGSYQPTGNSPLGMADASGNVAEWTSTAAGGNIGNSADNNTGTLAFVVKGGGFHDGPEALLVRSQRVLPAGAIEPWLGFRCAADRSR